MFPFALDASTELRLLDETDAEVFFSVIQQNRAYLDRWLRWSAGVQTLADARVFLERFAQKANADDGFYAGIFCNGALVGGIVCHYINPSSNKTEIGYWLAEDAVGKGLVTRSCEVVLKVLFEDKGLHRVEIQCGVENERSRAVPIRLGFVQEGIKRDSEWITNRYVDHVVYSMLDHEWRARA